MTWTKETFPYQAQARTVGQVQILWRRNESQSVYSIWLFSATNIRYFKRRRQLLIMHLDSHMNVFEWEKKPFNFWPWKGMNLNWESALTGTNLINYSCLSSPLGFDLLFDNLQLTGNTAPPAIGLKLMKEASLEHKGWPRETLEEHFTPGSCFWLNELFLSPSQTGLPQ